jgi:hypothetical protein
MTTATVYLRFFDLKTGYSVHPPQAVEGKLSTYAGRPTVHFDRWSFTPEHSVASCGIEYVLGSTGRVIKSFITSAELRAGRRTNWAQREIFIDDEGGEL